MSCIEYDGGITAQQTMLASRIETVLTSKSAERFKREQIGDTGHRPAFEYHLSVRPVDLQVHLSLLQDTFHIQVNVCQVIVEAAGFGGDYESWADECVRIISAMVNGGLRLSTRTLFGRRMWSWVSIGRNGAWSSIGGEGIPVGKRGDQVFQDWY